MGGLISSELISTGNGSAIKGVDGNNIINKANMVDKANIISKNNHYLERGFLLTELG